MIHVGSIFIGRLLEVESLQKAFRQAEASDFSVVVVSGEPGIGKTTLLGEFAQYAREAGAVVLRGGALDFEAMPPYLPWLEALGQYLKSIEPGFVRALLGPKAPILAELLPEL